eukprot:SAG11_NODE_14657_length_604_cov_1.015842_1_plen_74_part_00
MVVSGRARYFYVGRDSLQQLQREAARTGRPIEKAPLALRQGDMYFFVSTVVNVVLASCAFLPALVCYIRSRST